VREKKNDYESGVRGAGELVKQWSLMGDFFRLWEKQAQKRRSLGLQQIGWVGGVFKETNMELGIFPVQARG